MPFTEFTPEDMETMDREELMDRITELQDLLNETKETHGKVSHTPERPKKKVPISDYHIMRYVRGDRAKNSAQIINDVKEYLKRADERTDGLYIAFNNHKKAIYIQAWSKIGLDMMEDRIMELIQEANDKVESGELRPQPFTKGPHRTHHSHHNRQRHHHSRDYDDRSRHYEDHSRHHDDYYRRNHRRNPHDEAHLYRGTH